MLDHTNVLRSAPVDDDLADGIELPPAVLCIRCGRSDCVGCLPPEPPEGGVPWEQLDVSVWRRLWQTARESSVNGETFFGTLTDGGVAGPLRFALSCELLAIGSLLVLWTVLMLAIAPQVVDLVWQRDHRWLVAGALVLSVPVLAVFMVALHVVWGTTMEVGVWLQGGRPRFSHVWRYALYSCGWDLLTSPLGIAAGSIAGGVFRAISDTREAIAVPRRATRAYLLRARHLTDERATRAVWGAAVVTGALVLLGAAALVGLIALSALTA